MVKIEMLLSLCWAFTALASQTLDQQLTAGNYSNATAPSPPDMAFRLRRAPRDETGREKRSIKVAKALRAVDYCYYIDLDIGTPLRRIEAELHPKYRGTYIRTITKSELFTSQIYPTLRVLRLVKDLMSPMTSKTYKRRSTYFTTYSEYYGSAYANFAEDDLYLGVPLIRQFRFLVVEHKTEKSMIGLGMKGGAGYVSDDFYSEETTNLMRQMQERGWSQRNVFSMWIGSEDSDLPGIFMFYSIDYKYIQDDRLYIFPLIQPVGSKGYFIKLDAVSLVTPWGEVTYIALCSLAIELDFTNPFSALPEDVVMEIYKDFSIQPGKHYQVNCHRERKRGSLGLVLSGQHFLFPFRQIIPDCQDNNDIDAPLYIGKPVLGANFLSVLYMVFDQDNREVGLGVVRTNPDAAAEPNRVKTVGDHLPGERAPLYSCSKRYSILSIVSLSSYNSTQECLFMKTPSPKATPVYETKILYTAQTRLAFNSNEVSTSK